MKIFNYFTGFLVSLVLMASIFTIFSENKQYGFIAIMIISVIGFIFTLFHIIYKAAKQ